MRICVHFFLTQQSEVSVPSSTLSFKDQVSFKQPALPSPMAWSASLHGWGWVSVGSSQWERERAHEGGGIHQS